MVIGRQEETGHGGRIDLLGIAPDGTLVPIEVNRSRTPREVLAQALDYAGWVEGLKTRSGTSVIFTTALPIFILIVCDKADLKEPGMQELHLSTGSTLLPVVIPYRYRTSIENHRHLQKFY